MAFLHLTAYMAIKGHNVIIMTVQCASKQTWPHIYHVYSKTMSCHFQLINYCGRIGWFMFSPFYHTIQHLDDGDFPVCVHLQSRQVCLSKCSDVYYLLWSVWKYETCNRWMFHFYDLIRCNTIISHICYGYILIAQRYALDFWKKNTNWTKLDVEFICRLVLKGRASELGGGLFNLLKSIPAIIYIYYSLTKHTLLDVVKQGETNSM
jgi:hypothetical protein